MLIRILAGAYGHRPDPEKSYIEKKDRDSEPFEVSDKEAERLIRFGIAEKAAVNIEKELDKDPNSVNTDSHSDELEQLPIQKLRKMAKDLGLLADGSKAVLAEKIRNASSKNGNTDDGQDTDDVQDRGNTDDEPGHEAPPILQAAEPEV
ncbi:MAG: hypothetical protein K2O91_19755 [Lachnospiraceae bacterium]|nr:hypothetical protein [Lachnospiraceae bacterium]